jgi:hypothetical protein
LAEKTVYKGYSYTLTSSNNIRVKQQRKVTLGYMQTWNKYLVRTLERKILPGKT